MNAESAALLDLLRCELDATNQQFTHILALREWQLQEAADRIAAVDNVDFSNALRIADHLVKSGAAITLAGAEFNPGTDYASILRAEQAMEARLVAALERSAGVAAPARRLVEAARGPRASYARWLAEAIAAAAPTSSENDVVANALASLVTQLVTLIEQSMLHAFVEWHGGNEPAADAAWATSGAAMMQLTRLVRLCATLPGVPAGGACPAAAVCSRPGATLDADRARALGCAGQADAVAARCNHPALARYCSGIAVYYRRFHAWQPPAAHPAAGSNPPVFRSFAATLRKFVL